MNKKLHIKNRLFNQRLPKHLLIQKQVKLLLKKVQLLDRRTLDRIIPHLEEGYWFQNIITSWWRT